MEANQLQNVIPEAKSFPGSPTHTEPLSDVQIAQELIRIPSYNSEEAIGQWIAQFVHDFGPKGFDTQRLPVGVEGRDTILIANEREPDFILLSHIDTVDPWVVGSEKGQGQYDPFGGTIENGRIYGVGASDQKGSAASILRALAHYKGNEQDLPKMMIAFTSMEERDLEGAIALSAYFRKLGDVNPNYHPGFILETGSDRQIGWECRGCVALGIDFRGETGHAAVRTPGTKEPIDAFERGVDVLRVVKQKIHDSSETRLGRTTANSGSGKYGLLGPDGEIIEGRDNRVPDVFRPRIEFRPNGGLFEGEPINATTISNLITREAEMRGLSVAQITAGLDVAGWVGNREDAKWIEDIAKDVLNTDVIDIWDASKHGLGEAAVVLGGASNDGREKIGGASFGTADSTQFHKVDESVGLGELPPQTEIFSRTISEFTLQ